MNDLIIALPKEAVQIEKDILSLPIVNVMDEKTKIAAAENMKFGKKFLDEFEKICNNSDAYLSHRIPLDAFLALRKESKKKIEDWIAAHSKKIGDYESEIIRQENERIKAEQEKANEEAAEKAKECGEVPAPVQKAVEITQSKTKSSFVSLGVKMKPDANITDLTKFIEALVTSGSDDWIKLIFPKYSESELKKFCIAKDIDGIKKTYPGLNVKMVPVVGTR